MPMGTRTLLPQTGLLQYIPTQTESTCPILRRRTLTLIHRSLPHQLRASARL